MGIPESWSSISRTGFARFFPHFEGVDLNSLLFQDNLSECIVTLQTRELIVSHSYHVAILAQIAGVPCYLVARNDYYRQKKEGLGIKHPSLDAFLSADLKQIAHDQEIHLENHVSERNKWLEFFKDVVMQEPGLRRDLTVGAQVERTSIHGRSVTDTLATEQGETGNSIEPSHSEDNLQESDWEEEYHLLKAQLHQLQAELDMVRSSKSWRWTRPLRAIYRLGKFAKKSLLSWRTQKPRQDFPEPVYLSKKERFEVIKEGSEDHSEVHVLTQEPWDPSLPLVSVIIPCYNYGEYLDEAIDSVLTQTFQDFEVIVVDDGSTDFKTLDVLKKLSKRKTRVMHQSNMGLPTARNNGIQTSKGKYICCLDADDTLESTYLEKAVWLLEANPDVGFAYSWVGRFGTEGGVWKTQPFNLKRLLSYNHISVAAVFRHSAWEEVNGYWPEMRPGYEDWEFWIHLGASRYPGRLIPEPLLNHRRHGPSMLDDAVEKHAVLFEKIQNRHLLLYQDSQLVEDIQRNYKHRRADQPGLNLNRDEQYKSQDEAATQIVLVLGCVLDNDGYAQLTRVMKELKVEDHDQSHLITTLTGAHAQHPNLRLFSSVIFHLPNFLPEYTWREYVVNFIRSRNIDHLLIYQSSFAYSILPEIKREAPGLKITEVELE
jgi:glycosyltransferase involved in cell wall biosynthesis